MHQGELEIAGESIETKSIKPGSFIYIWKSVSGNTGAMVGLCAIILIVCSSFISPLIMEHHYATINIPNRYARPSSEHLFGTDELGRDIMSRVLYGARFTLAIGFGSVLISATFGILLGSIAGFFGKKTDQVIMRLLDVFQAFPQLLLAITLSAVLGVGLDKCILALGIAGIPGFARLMRANIFTIRNLEYIEAAYSINCSKFRIIWKHVIPNAFSPVIVQISMSIASAGLSAAGLSFLGLGVQPPTPEWGSMLAGARIFIRDHPQDRKSVV